MAAPMCSSGDMIKFALATMALSQSPTLIAFKAWWRAKMDEEHAVSTVKLSTNEQIHSQIQGENKQGILTWARSG